jgi:hypothetical protein
MPVQGSMQQADSGRSGLITILLSLAPSVVQAETWGPWPPPRATVAVPSSGPTGGENVLIADRGNNRLLLVSPDKQILWEYDFPHLPRNAGADDSFFADNGKSIVVNLEHWQVVQIIDIATKQVTWSYGTPGKRGAGAGLLDYPDDAYQLPNGDIVIADIRNCRVIEIAPDKHIVRQYGVTGRCSGPATLASPNGDKPLANGHVLISTIRDHGLTELDQTWQPIFHLKLPLRYPSDPQMTHEGNYLIADYSRPGRIVEIDHSGKILWDYMPTAGDAELNRPSLAVELPDGNIIANDDLNHRVIVIDKSSKKIIWQYGVTGRAGAQPGYLSIPDGFDLQKAD